MTESISQQTPENTELTPIKVIRGQPTFLFPVDKPLNIEYGNCGPDISQDFDVEGLGTFSISFGVAALNPDNLQDSVVQGNLSILATEDGPIVFKPSSELAVRIDKATDLERNSLLHFELIDLPYELYRSGNVPEIHLILPHLKVVFDNDGVYDLTFDPKIEEAASYFHAKDEDGKEIDYFLIQNSEKLLQQVQIEVL